MKTKKLDVKGNVTLKLDKGAKLTAKGTPYGFNNRNFIDNVFDIIINKNGILKMPF